MIYNITTDPSKQYIMTLVIIMMVSLHSSTMFGGFAARSAEQQADTYQEDRNAYYRPGQGTTDNSTGCCPAGQQCMTPSNSSTGLTTYVPTFVVQLNDANGKILNGNGLGHVFNTPSPNNGSYPNGFNLATSVFSVHIFPKSNAITSTSPVPTYASNDSGYIIIYTLKDPSGNIFYKEIDQNIPMQTLPHQITLVLNPNAPVTPTPTTSTTTTTTQAATWTTTTSPTNVPMIANSVFIPRLSTITKASARQQIINGISPIVQKFLFSLNSAGGTISAYPISGTFDADDTASTISYAGTSPGGSITSGTNIGQFSIAFDGTQYLTFTNPAEIAFTQQDLINGLILNVSIFASEANNNYPIVATLRTLDGLKLQKTSCINYTAPGSSTPAPSVYLQSLPATISILYAPASTAPVFTTQLTTSFLNNGTIENNSSIANQAFIMNGTINLRFIISRPSGGNFSINMV